jgi:hypothetical protein
MGCDRCRIYRCHRSLARKTPTIVMTPEGMHTTGVGYMRSMLRDPQEEGGDGSGRGGGLINPAWLLSGDGCGDGGYCHGVWVRPSEKGHRHGEKIGGSAWEPLEGLCWIIPGNPICGTFEKIRKATSE